MIFFLQILYVLTSIVLVGYLIRIYKKDGLNCSLVINGFFSLYYIFVPTLLLIMEEQLELQGVGRLLVIYSELNSKGFISWIYTIISFTVINIAIKYRFTFGTQQVYMKTRSSSTEESPYFDVLGVRRLGHFFMVIGGISLLMLFNQLGGLSRALSLGGIIRAYSTSKETYLSASGSMFKTLSPMILAAGYCYFTCLFHTKKTTDKVLWIISFILSLFYLIFNAGRSDLVFFLIIYIFGYSMMKQKNILWIAISLGIVVIVGSELLGTVIDLIATRQFSLDVISNNYNLQNNLLATLSDLSYPYCNLLCIDDITSQFGYRFFTDYFAWIISILPSRLLGIDFSNYRLATTEISSYFQNSIALFKGGTPVDIVSYGLMQFPLLGLIVNSFFYGKVVRIITDIKGKIGSGYGPLLWSIYIFTFDTLLSSDLMVLVKSKLAQVIILCYLLRISKRVQK